MRVALTKTRKAKVLQLPSAFNVNFQSKKLYFLRFTRVITSFSCTQFLRKLAPTLYTHIYWVQANIMSMGKLGAWVQLPVITVAKPRK